MSTRRSSTQPPQGAREATTRDEAMQVARRAFEGFARGNRTGNWEDFLEALTEDVTMWVPAPGRFQGENEGKDRVEAFCRFISEEQEARLTFEEPFRTVASGRTVVFEFADEGTIAGESVSNRIAMSMDVRDGRVEAIREYVGVIG